MNKFLKLILQRICQNTYVYNWGSCYPSLIKPFVHKVNKLLSCISLHNYDIISHDNLSFTRHHISWLRCTRFAQHSETRRTILVIPRQANSADHIIAMLYLRYLCVHQVPCTVLQLRLSTFNPTRKLLKVQAIF
jgi:hypothetical protein